jgi:hypothetical protein
VAFAGFNYAGDMLPEQVKLKDTVNQWFARSFTTRLNRLVVIIAG